MTANYHKGVWPNQVSPPLCINAVYLLLILLCRLTVILYCMCIVIGGNRVRLPIFLSKYLSLRVWIGLNESEETVWV